MTDNAVLYELKQFARLLDQHLSALTQLEGELDQAMDRYAATGEEQYEKQALEACRLLHDEMHYGQYLKAQQP